MGNVKIRYYVTRKAWPGSRARWGYWVPTPKMKAAGFKQVTCGEDGPAAWAIAHRMNAQWDAFRRGETQSGKIERIYPGGSLGEAFGRFRALKTWLEKKPRTREDWERGWKYIEPVFADVDPRTISLEDLDAWYAALLDTAGIREAHRAMKIWRALWRVCGTMTAPHGDKYCNRDEDPSLGIRRKTPTARSAIWFEGEAVRLVKQQWRLGFRGLACICAVAWDTQLSPVDARKLTAAQRAKDGKGPLYFVDRTKTGAPAIGTVSKRTARLVETYLAEFGAELHDDAPLFRNRSGAPYSKDTLGDDFRAVRAIMFPGDKRKLMDFRRSGAVEALAGEVDPTGLATVMGNTIDKNRELQRTYLPQHTAAVVRLVDEARARGRARLRDGNRTKS